MEYVTIYKILSAPYAILFHITMFFVMNEYRYPRKKAAYFTIFLNVPILVLTMAVYLMLGSERGGQLAVLFYIIPQIAVGFFLSKYRDARVFSTYFVVSGIFIFIIQISNLLDYYTSGESHIVMFLVQVITYPLVLFFLVRYIAKPYRRALNVLRDGWNIYAYISCIFTLLLLIVFNFPTTLSKRPYDIPVLVLLFLVMVLTNLTFMNALLRQNDYYKEAELNQYLEHQMEMLKSRIKYMEKSEKNTAIYRHDMRHILTTLSGMLSGGAYDDAAGYIENRIGVIDSDTETKWCRNTTMNAMFQAYFAEAKNKSIRIDANIDLDELDGDENVVLSLVCANAIENAIHAVVSLPVEERVIRVKILQSPKLMLSVSNPYSGSITFDDNGIPVSEKEGHGLGIESIYTYCKKHNAVCDFKVTDDWFAIRIVKN